MKIVCKGVVINLTLFQVFSNFCQASACDKKLNTPVLISIECEMADITEPNNMKNMLQLYHILTS